MIAPVQNPWLVTYRANRRSRLKLICFPHAGSSASAYGAWPENLPPEIDVCAVEYPGRGSRRAETPHVSIQSLVTALVPHISQELSNPFAVFGHSMGAFIAFEFLRRLQFRSGQRPAVFIAGACRPPSLPPSKPPIHSLPETEFLRELRALNGTPESILSDPNFMRLFLPTLRADLQAAETYAYRAGPKLKCAISVYGGHDDPEIDADSLELWGRETDGTFQRHLFAGDHFFFQTAERAVMERLQLDLLERINQPSA